MTFYRQDSFSQSFVGGNIPLSRADRQPCPVCGHPTGDCVGESKKPEHIAGFNQIESMKLNQTVLVEEDIWEEIMLTPFTKTKILVYPKGRQIPIAEAEKLGLI
jgi:hypothetical protein